MAFNVPSGSRRRQLTRGAAKGIKKTKPAPRAKPAPKPDLRTLLPASQPLPIDPIHTGQSALIEQQKQNLLAQIPYQQNLLASEYGFLPGSTTIDPSNPYSRAGLLERSYWQGQRGTTNSFASRGQLYSGATQRNLDEGTFNYSRNQDSLQKAYQGSLNDLTQQKTQGLFDLSQQQIDADADRIARAPDPVPTGPTAADVAAFFRSGKKKPKKMATYSRKRVSYGGRSRLG